MTTIYHNPRCSKSRQTIDVLEDNGIEYQINEYLRTPPNKRELKNILAKLGMQAVDVIRKNEKILTELKVDLSIMSEAELISLILNHPILLERPIVVTDTAARIGRPPESVLELFE